MERVPPGSVSPPRCAASSLVTSGRSSDGATNLTGRMCHPDLAMPTGAVLFRSRSERSPASERFVRPEQFHSASGQRTLHPRIPSHPTPRRCEMVVCRTGPAPRARGPPPPGVAGEASRRGSCPAHGGGLPLAPPFASRHPRSCCGGIARSRAESGGSRPAGEDARPSRPTCGSLVLRLARDNPRWGHRPSAASSADSASGCRHPSAQPRLLEIKVLLQTRDVRHHPQ